MTKTKKRPTDKTLNRLAEITLGIHNLSDDVLKAIVKYGYEKGRAKAFEKCKGIITEHKKKYMLGNCNLNCMIEILEEINKEETNDIN